MKADGFGCVLEFEIGRKYRLKIQNEKNGAPVYSDEAILTVRKKPKIK